MCELISSVDWSGVIQAFAALATAVIAYLALNTWKRQAKAAKKSEILDRLTERTYAYIQALSRPIEFFTIIEIQIESRKMPNEQSSNPRHARAIRYIENRGKEDSEKLWEYLEASRGIAAEVEALVARGGHLDFKDYERCRHSVSVLLLQQQKLAAVASVIGNNSLNWENETVLETLDNVLKMQPSDLKEHLRVSGSEFSEFIKENYRAIY